MSAVAAALLYTIVLMVGVAGLLMLLNWAIAAWNETLERDGE